MQHSYKAVLVGLGRMGSLHLKKIEHSGLFKLVAAIDPNAGPHSEDLPIFKNTEDFEMENIDYQVAVVATPTPTHFEVAQYFLDHSKAVLMEKPLCLNGKEARQLEALSLKNNCLLSVGHIERHNPALKKLKEIIDSKWLGNVTNFSFTRIGPAPKVHRPGNNVILDLSIHDFDILNYLCDADENKSVDSNFEVKSCLAHFEKDFIAGAEILLQNKLSQSASLHSSWLSQVKKRTLQIEFQKGLCEIDFIEQSLNVLECDPKNNPPPFEDCHHEGSNKLIFEIQKEEPLLLQYQEFHKALQELDNNMCSVDSGAKAVELAQAAIAIASRK